MKIHRIYAILLRFVLAMKYSLERLTDFFYWPVIDLLMWGITSAYIQTLGPDAANITMIILTGLVLWIIVWRGQYEIGLNLLADVWNRNLINIFVSPLKFSEWMVSFLLLGFIKAILSFVFGIFVAFMLYKVRLFEYGFYFIPYIFLLIMTGWWIGFIIVGLIFRIGRRVEAFAWTLGALIAPFSAVYYPVAILPKWAQYISAALPTSYVFESAREVIHNGYFDVNKVVISFILNIVYLILTAIFLKRGFDKLLKRGIINVY